MADPSQEEQIQEFVASYGLLGCPVPELCRFCHFLAAGGGTADLGSDYALPEPASEAFGAFLASPFLLHIWENLKASKRVILVREREHRGATELFVGKSYLQDDLEGGQQQLGLCPIDFTEVPPPTHEPTPVPPF